MVVLVDDGDGARVQVDPQEVRPHLHAALQLVGVLDPSQLAVDGVDTQGRCCSQRGHHCIVKTAPCDMTKGLSSDPPPYLNTEAWSKNQFQPGSPLSGDENRAEDKTLDLIHNISSTKLGYLVIERANRKSSKLRKKESITDVAVLYQGFNLGVKTHI